LADFGKHVLTAHKPNAVRFVNEVYIMNSMFDRLPGCAGRISMKMANSRRLARAAGVAAAMLALGCALPAMAGNATWTQVGYNSGHTGYNSTEKKITAKNAAHLVNSGSFNTQGQIIEQPVIYKGMVYTRSGDGNLYAFNQKTGAIAWSIGNYASPIGPNWGMAAADDKLVVSCVTGDNTSGLCAYNAKSGKSLWTYGLTSGGGYSPPTIAGDTVYFLTSGAESGGSVKAQHLSAVNLKNGKEIWRIWYCDDYPTCEGFGGSPAVDNGVIYVGCSGVARYPVIQVVGVCAFTTGGSLLWQHQLGNDSSGNGTDGNGNLVAQNGRVYAAYETNCTQCNYSLDITALNGASGTAQWDTPIAGPFNGEAYFAGPPVLGPDGSTYEVIGEGGGDGYEQLFALNAKGSLRWKDGNSVAFAGTPTLVGKGKKGVLFFSCATGQGTGTTCAFDASKGSFLWESSDANDTPAYSPIVTGGVVYNSCGFNNICIYQAQ
jgi:outer membrane protein assembly factor BamB